VADALQISRVWQTPPTMSRWEIRA